MLSITTAVAVPARPGQTRQLMLADGSTVNALLVGDEHGHFWQGADGRAYRLVAGTGYFQVVSRQAVLERAGQRRAAINSQRVKRLPGRRNVGEVGGIVGQKKGLVIMVNFSDVSFQTAHDNALYKRIANEKGFSYGSFKGSVRDYFYDQSQGKFELTFDVVGPVTVSRTQEYYGSNDSDDNDLHAAELVIEALCLADGEVNYADYDWDGDGVVEQVYVVYAGKGEADGGDASTIWPHEWTLSSANYYGDGNGAQYLDGVKIDTYACGGELNGSNDIAGIGTMCHEFSHCLGYPDFYDTDYSGGQGMGYWDLMDGGSYNANGYQPAGYTSYERWVAGWETPTELLYTQSVSNMEALQKGGGSYIIYNSGTNNEYFLLENRQKTGWDTSLPGAGLLILHVDYDTTVWGRNQPNDDPSHQRMTWIAADNNYQYSYINGSKSYSFSGMASDTYPYGNNNSFSKNSTPAATLYNNNADGTKYLDSSVENITQNSDGTVSFQFKGISHAAAPTFTPKAGRYTEAQTVVISCPTQGASIYYTIDGSTPTAFSTLYTGPITVSTTTTVKAIAIKDEDESEVATAKYIIKASDTNTFKLVKSTSELESGMRYIIACGSKAKAAGALNGTFLNSVDVTISDDVITIGDSVAVFVLEQTAKGWSFMNEKNNIYLTALDPKKLGDSSSACDWTLSNGKDGGVIMTCGDYGTMLYNVSSPRFNTYTSSPTASMIQANLYMEYTDGLKNVAMSFSPTEAEATMGKDFDEPVLTITPAGLAVTYRSSNPDAATVDATTGEVTLIAEGVTTITATFAGNEAYNAASASYKLTVLAAERPVPATSAGYVYELVTDASALATGDEILIASVNDSVAVALGTNQKTLNREAVRVTLNDEGTLTPGANAQVVTLEKNGDNYLFNVGDGYLYAASSSKNELKTETLADDNAKASIAIGDDGYATITFQGTNTRNVMRFNPNNGSPLFSCYASTSTVGSLPQLYRRVPDVTVTIGRVGYATLYYSDKNLQLPKGVEAYTFYLDNDVLQRSAVDSIIGKGVAVVLKDTEADNVSSHSYQFAVVNNGTVPAQNSLYGYDEAATTSVPAGGDYKYYMLSLNKASELSSVGFYYGAPDGAAFSCSAHKAFLALPRSLSSNVVAYLFDGSVSTDDTTTGISESVSRDSANGKCFNLNGQRMAGVEAKASSSTRYSSLRKGIYIIGGRKVVVK